MDASTTDSISSALAGEVGARCTVPLQTIEVTPHCDGVVAFQRLLSGYGPHPRHLFFLDSALRHHGLSHYSILGCQPFLVLKSKGHTITVEDDAGDPQKKEGNPFEVLRSYLRAFRVEDTVGAYCNMPLPLPDICRTGVAVGYLGYDLRHFLECLPSNTVDDLKFPDMYFGFYDKFVVYDHKEGRCFLVGKNLEGDIQELSALLSAPGVGRGTACRTSTKKKHQLKGNFTKKRYIEAIRQAKEYIARGDIYQVNLSQRFQTELEGAPHELYLRLRDINPAPFSAYLQFEDNVIISSSPERFLRVHGGRVQTCPIKGTRPRGADPASDQRLMTELLHSPKDNAELAMIVDLERNDLGKVCCYGSVRVMDKRRLEA
ncbi:MAG: anthranilate synthase component I family protein, partial [Candidatus Brocadiales bacterium]